MLDVGFHLLDSSWSPVSCFISLTSRDSRQESLAPGLLYWGVMLFLASFWGNKQGLSWKRRLLGYSTAYVAPKPAYIVIVWTMKSSFFSNEKGWSQIVALFARAVFDRTVNPNPIFMLPTCCQVTSLTVRCSTSCVLSTFHTFSFSSFLLPLMTSFSNTKDVCHFQHFMLTCCLAIVLQLNSLLFFTFYSISTLQYSKCTKYWCGHNY